MVVHEIKHPLVQHKMTLIRDSQTKPKLFRELAAELATVLMYECLREVRTESKIVAGWAGKFEGERLPIENLTVVPILRAGLGLLPGVLHAVPHAEVSMVGMYRDEQTLEPKPYFQKPVDRIATRTAIIIDPMLATGGTCVATVDMLREAGCRSFCALFMVAAPEGLKRLESAHPEITVFTAAIDDGLNDAGYILPGLGDAGDRIFGTSIG